MDPIRRNILATGAAATAMAAAPRLFCSADLRKEELLCPFYEKKAPFASTMRRPVFRLPVVAHCRRGIEFDDLRVDQRRSL